MVCLENGRDRRSEAGFGNVARTSTYGCSSDGSRASEYVLFDCSAEIPLIALLGRWTLRISSALELEETIFDTRAVFPMDGPFIF